MADQRDDLEPFKDFEDLRKDPGNRWYGIPVFFLRAIFGEYIAAAVGIAYFGSFVVSLVVGYRLLGFLGFFIAFFLMAIAGLPALRLIRFFERED
ncbi:MAG: hypothetical protein AAF797_16920 [Planctomycetota bacterium]